MARQKGEGYIFKRGKIFYLQFNVEGKRKIISLKTTERRKAEKKAEELLAPAVNARDKEEVLMHAAKARKLVKSDNIPVDELWNIYKTHPGRLKCRPETFQKYQYKIERFSNWMEHYYPGMKFLSRIDKNIALEYAGNLETDNLSARTFNDHIAALRIVFKTLLDLSDSENPWRKKNITPKQEVSISRKALTENEVLSVFAVFDDSEFSLLHKHEMRALFNVACWTALRLKDAVLLKWDSVDLEHNFIRVIPSKTRKRKKPVKIPMHPQLREALETALDWRADEYVFPELANRYRYNPSGVSKDCTKVFRKAGFDTAEKINDEERKLKANRYGLHSFRHTFVSFCAKSNIPYAVTKELVGHGNPAMTEYYASMDDETQERAIQALPQFKTVSNLKELSGGMTDSQKLETIRGLLEGKKRLNDTEKKILDIL